MVNDDSYNKIDPTVSYEMAKIEAEENAKQLAEELDISIVFFDWINVVPNVLYANACLCSVEPCWWNVSEGLCLWLI